MSEFCICFQFSSVTQLCPTLCDPMNRSTPDLPVHQQLLEFTQTHVHWVGDAIQPSHPLSPSPPTFNLSQYQGLFKWVSSSHQVAKVLELQLQSFSPSNEHSGLISFRMEWLDLFAVQGTLKDSLQHQSSKALFLRHSAFFIIQLSHPYMTTGKTIALTRSWLDGPFPAYGVNKIWKNTLFKKWISERGLKDESIWAGESLGKSQLQVLR